MRCLVLRSLLGLLTIFSLTRVGNADALEVTLSEGDVVPMFEAKAADGMVWRSVDHVGKKIIVVYFYPADLTGGCTPSLWFSRPNEGLGKSGRRGCRSQRRFGG